MGEGEFNGKESQRSRKEFNGNNLSSRGKKYNLEQSIVKVEKGLSKRDGTRDKKKNEKQKAWIWRGKNILEYDIHKKQ